MILLLLIVPLSFYGQKGLNLITATSQHWNGGVEGISGCYFVFDFSFSPKDSISIDSVCVNGHLYFADQSANSGQGAFYLVFQNEDKKMMRLNIEETYNSNRRADCAAEKKTGAHKKMKGVALVYCRVNKKKKQIAVNQFTVLETINYP